MLALHVLLSIPVVLVAAEHSGAYSSPQYAKKMYPKQFDTNALLPSEKNPTQFKNIDRFDSDANDTSQYARSSFLNSAGSFLSGAGGQMVSNLAKDFLARSTGSSQVGFDCVSQVLSLNLTNLVILIVLKALILAAGFFGAGAWKGGHHYARSLDGYTNAGMRRRYSCTTEHRILAGPRGEDSVLYNRTASYITEDEILLYLSYLAGQQSQDYGCLYRMSCQKPQQAALYSSGAEILLQGAKLLQGNSIELESYEEVSKGIKQASAWGEEGMNCDARYQCGE